MKANTITPNNKTIEVLLISFINMNFNSSAKEIDTKKIWTNFINDFFSVNPDNL